MIYCTYSLYLSAYLSCMCGFVVVVVVVRSEYIIELVRDEIGLINTVVALKIWQQFLYSRQRLQGVRIWERRKRKMMKELEKLKEKLAKEKRKAEKYKKRYRGWREKHHQCLLMQNSKCQNVRSPIKRALFHTTLVENIRRKYRNTKTERERQLIARVTSGNIFKKYKLQKYTQTAFGYSKKRSTTFSVELSATVKRKESCAAMEISGKWGPFFSVTMLAIWHQAAN